MAHGVVALQVLGHWSARIRIDTRATPEQRHAGGKRRAPDHDVDH